MRLGLRAALLMMPVFAAVACGGGGGASGDGGVIDPSPTPLSASFLSDDNTPSSKTIAMIQGPRNADLVTVRVTVTDTTGIYGAAFEVVYDTAKAAYVNWSAGTLLEQGGHSPSYTVGDNGSGRVVVAASRNGNVATVNAAGTVTLVNLTFRVKQAGESRAVFAAGPVLYDGQATPQPKSGILWTAGALVGTQ
jgi:hypothetical protein